MSVAAQVSGIVLACVEIYNLRILSDRHRLAIC